jgi:hypothetical protein
MEEICIEVIDIVDKEDGSVVLELMLNDPVQEFLI